MAPIAAGNIQDIRAAIARHQASSRVVTSNLSGIPDTQHISFLAGNTRISFPFQPYPPQRQYAEKVIEALSKGTNAILESPTGTGKTMTLICSTLAWTQEQTGVKSIIYYTSRTHLQLDQAAKEMKKTAYSRNPSVVLASRSHMCLNDDVKIYSSDQINRGCRNAIAKNSCQYFSNYEQKLETIDQNQVYDIEDLISIGRSKQICPYYASRKLAETKANIIFMPYNYLIEPSLNRSAQLKLENSIVIFDEAHNIENSLKDAVSGSFSQSCLKTIRESCLKLPAKISDALNQEKHGLSRYGYDPSTKRSGPAVIDEFKTTSRKASNSSKDKNSEKEIKVNPIEELAEKLTNENLQRVNRCAESLLQKITNHMRFGETATVDKVSRLLEEADVTFVTSNLIITTLESMASFWSIASVIDPVLVARYVAATTNFCNFLSLLFPDAFITLARQQSHMKKLQEYYVAHFEGEYKESSVLKQSNELKDWTLNLWCLHPSIGMQRVFDSSCVNGPRSIIITSGTLTPMWTMKQELGIPFDIIETFQHVIGKEQLKMMIIGHSPNGQSLQSNHQATKDEKYFDGLVKTLAPMLKVLPFGTLIFFSSYDLMRRLAKYWRDKQLSSWRDVNKCSKIFIESKDTFDRDLNDYKKEIELKGKAVFLGVVRGKLSEGVNLIDNQCRSLILTGLPFPNVTDSKIKATRQFHGKHGDSNGNKWYMQQMRRALNQTVGRVIRSRKDFGLLLLCDPRFTNLKFDLSPWTHEFFPPQETRMCEVQESIKSFFSNHGISINQTLSENHGAFEIEISTLRSNSTSNSTQRPSYSQLPEDWPDTSQSQSQTGIRTLDKQPSRMITSGPQSQPNGPQQLKPPSQSNPTGSSQMGSQPRMNARALLEARRAQMFGSVPSDPVEESLPVAEQPMSCIRAPRGPSPKRRRLQAASQSSNPTQSSSSNKEYSIVRDSRDKNRPSGYKCEICGALPPDKPLRTLCSCAKVACRSCIKVLDQKKCNKCGTLWVFKDFKPVLFKSSFFAKNKAR